MKRSSLLTISLLLILTLTAKAQITTFPYLEQFSVTPSNWTISTSSGTAWEIGAPTATGTSGSFSTPFCAGTDLDSGYRAFTTAYLISPRFDISGLTNPLFSFYQFRYMSTGLDGMHIEFSTDDVSWQQLGTVGSPTSFNWYNSTSIFATFQPAFTGNSNGWIQSGFYLQGITTGLIRFRFVFRSNSSFGSAQPGVFVDDVKVENSTSPIADVWSSTNPGYESFNQAGVKSALNLRISNFSSGTTIDSAFVGYYLNGVLQMNQFRSIQLPPGVTDTLFIDSITLPAGEFIFKTFLSFPGDPNRNNDTVIYGGIAFGSATVPYTEDFESGTSLWYAQTLNPQSIWELGQPNFGSTNTTHAGTNAWDINLGTPYSTNANATLYSPVFDLSGPNAYQLKFWHNCQTELNYDGTRVDYSIDGGLTWLILGFQNDPLGTNWYTSNSIQSTGFPAWDGLFSGWTQSSYRLTNFIGQSQFQLRFVFTSDGFVTADGYSIDDFEIAQLPGTDAAYISLNNNLLNPIQGQNSGNISIKFYNKGTQPINSFTASYTLNSIQQQSQVFNQTVNPGDTATVQLPGFIAPTGALNLCGFITLAQDADSSNNSGCFQTISIPTFNLPYLDDFESGASGWTTTAANQTSQWELGTPSFGTTNTTYSGSNCWDINLSTSYANNANATLYSPYFNVSGSGIFQISFWLNYFTENEWDGTRMEATTDGGVSWFIVGSLGDPYGTNWYNEDAIISSGLAGWTNNSAGWKKSNYRFDFLGPVSSIRFRFIFTSDNTSVRDGFSLDDFSIVEVPAFDATVTEINPASFYPPVGLPTPNHTVKIKNVGSQPFTGVSYGYTYNGTILSNVTYQSTIAPLDSVTLTVPGYTPLPGQGSLCAFVHLTNDPNTGNDTLCIDVTGTPIYTPYFQDDFDGLNYGWSSSTIGNQATQWQLGTPNFGQTNSAFTAPNCWDINLNAAYTERAESYLYSPWFDLSNGFDPVLTFMQNRNTQAFLGGFYIEWATPSSPFWSPLGTLNDPSGTNWYTQSSNITFPSSYWSGNSNGWIKSELPLTGNVAPGSLIQFRFVFRSSTNTIVSDGVSIDNFNIEVPVNNDAELKSVISPGSVAIENSPTAVEVLLRNNGLSTITSLDFKYSHNNGPLVSSTWTGSLPYDSVKTIPLPSILPTAGTNTLRIYSDWISDENHMNDTLDFTFTAIATSGIPYFNDFESGSGNWTSTNSGQSRWEYGTPAFSTTSGAYSGDSCWDINLNSPYGNLSNALLTSPIFDLGPNNIITLSFWHNYATEMNADGMTVEYSTNGTTWQPLGSIGSPNGTNWYNSTIYQNNTAWSGNSGGWVNSQYIYYKPSSTNYFQLRFRFISDFNLVNAGVSLDDISLSGVVGLNETGVHPPFKVYPNPANDKIFIQGDLQFAQQIRIYQSDGKLLWSGMGNSLPDVSTFAEGLYQMEIRYSGGEVAVTKFAVRH